MSAFPREMSWKWARLSRHPVERARHHADVGCRGQRGRLDRSLIVCCDDATIRGRGWSPRRGDGAKKARTYTIYGCNVLVRKPCAIDLRDDPEGAMAVILVIDDAATVRHLMRRVLTEARHSVIEAQDGEVGLSLFEAQRPCLVITDLFMPNREGIETIQQLRRLSPDAKIIAMSASGTATGKLYLGAANKLGADAILPKPFMPADLLAAVERVLARQPEQHASRIYSWR